MTDVNQIYYDNHFMIYVCEVMLYTLNVYSAICQLHLNEAKRKKKKNGTCTRRCKQVNPQWIGEVIALGKVTGLTIGEESAS